MFDFFGDHLENLYQLIDGDTYDLTMTIRAPPGPVDPNNKESYIKSVSCKNHRFSKVQDAVDILPRLKF